MIKFKQILFPQAMLVSGREMTSNGEIAMALSLREK